MTQLVIVYAIGILLLAYLSYQLYRLFFRKGYKHLCRNCPESKECNHSKTIHDGCRCNGRPD